MKGFLDFKLLFKLFNSCKMGHCYFITNSGRFGIFVEADLLSLAEILSLESLTGLNYNV